MNWLRCGGQAIAWLCIAASGCPAASTAPETRNAPRTFYSDVLSYCCKRSETFHTQPFTSLSAFNQENLGEANGRSAIGGQATSLDCYSIFDLCRSVRVH